MQEYNNSYLRMSPQFEALRMPVKSPKGLWAVLASNKPCNIRSRGGRIP